MRHGLPLALLIATFLASATACGGGGGTPDGGGDGGAGGLSDEDYFGLHLGVCFKFKGGLADSEYMHIGTERTTEGSWELVYRRNQVAGRTDFITVENGQVLLHRRQDVGNPGQDVKFDPPLVLLERPVQSTGTSPIVTDSTATEVNTSTTHTWKTSVTVGNVAEVTVPHGTYAEASPVFIVHDRADTGTPEQDQFDFVPELGFITADLDGTDWPAMKLVDVTTLNQGDLCNAI